MLSVPKLLTTLALCTAATAAALPKGSPSSLNLILAGPQDAQYWLLTEENLPAGTSRTSFTSDIPSSRLTRRGIECSGSHQANTGDCVALINALNNDSGNIQSSPRNIRYNNCYLSWSSVVEGIRFEFTPYARDVYNQCNSNDKVSGLTRDVQVGSGTTTVCLSNRASGCS